MMKLKIADGLKLYEMKQRYANVSESEMVDTAWARVCMTDTMNHYIFEFTPGKIEAWQNGSPWFVAS